MCLKFGIIRRKRADFLSDVMNVPLTQSPLGQTNLKNDLKQVEVWKKDYNIKLIQNLLDINRFKCKVIAEGNEPKQPMW